jgi:VWFA-related protein
MISVTALQCGLGMSSFRRALIVATALGLWSAHALTAGQQPFVERVEVARVLIDARVFDDRGRPVPDLGPSDFAVKIGGRPMRVESAEWVGSPSVDGEAASGVPGPAPGAQVTRAAAPGRLVVFLVQRDLQPLRITGLMQAAQLVDSLLQPLTRADRVAVLSFDSRLRIWTDFTNDLARVRSILAEDVISRRPGPFGQAGDVSLVSRLDPKRTARIHGIEHALQHLAQALEPLPGAKSLVLLGYGFGRYDARSGGVLLMDGYGEASAALQRGRVAVFTLNVTRANYNSLQAGLQTVSAETGGTYASTYEFPARAIERVTLALAGHYVLFVERPDLRPGVHRIEVRLTGRPGLVVARSTYVSTRARDASP